MRARVAQDGSEITLHEEEVLSEYLVPIFALHPPLHLVLLI